MSVVNPNSGWNSNCHFPIQGTDIEDKGEQPWYQPGRGRGAERGSACDKGPAPQEAVLSRKFLSVRDISL